MYKLCKFAILIQNSASMKTHGDFSAVWLVDVGEMVAKDEASMRSAVCPTVSRS